MRTVEATLQWSLDSFPSPSSSSRHLLDLPSFFASIIPESPDCRSSSTPDRPLGHPTSPSSPSHSCPIQREHRIHSERQKRRVAENGSPCEISRGKPIAIASLSKGSNQESC
ncbi:hypothetical protein SLEP1_g50738 [Rubroshorea leprosula]|uniref:Uncharacterized protein n=1 Tax=Rubroshorea leprosula TaxID=152421 RepID=A0AAV5M333_9ROSI|nr:hypothetical protein SLEP1_g50738 [Rubroshorea leprosula]